MGIWYIFAYIPTKLSCVSINLSCQITNHVYVRLVQNNSKGLIWKGDQTSQQQNRINFLRWFLFFFCKRKWSIWTIGRLSKAIKSSISLTEPTAHAHMILIHTVKLMYKLKVQNQRSRNTYSCFMGFKFLKLKMKYKWNSTFFFYQFKLTLLYLRTYDI